MQARTTPQPLEITFDTDYSDTPKGYAAHNRPSKHPRSGRFNKQPLGCTLKTLGIEAQSLWALELTTESVRLGLVLLIAAMQGPVPDSLAADFTRCR